jgi:acetyl esterase/lipase
VPPTRTMRTMKITGLILSGVLVFASGTCETATAQPYGAMDKLPDWVAVRSNIPYDRYPQTVLDIMQKKGDTGTNRPGMLVIHGGGWVRQAKERIVRGFCLPFVQRGFVVANVEYRLGTVAPAPAAVCDSLQAAHWFHQHAREYGVDSKKIAVIGESAGGHLALMVAMVTKSADLGPLTRVAAVIDVFGVADVSGLLFGPNAPWTVKEWVPEQPHRKELADRLSPVRYIRNGLPPILVIHGDSDDAVPYEQSKRLVAGLRQAGDDVEFLTVPNGKHGFTVEQWDGLLPQMFHFLASRNIQ